MATTLIQGYVRGPAGKPLSGVYVTIQGSEPGQLYSSFTDQTGYWGRAVVDGLYEITFLKGGYSFDPATLTVTVAGQGWLMLPDVTGQPGESLYNCRGAVLTQSGALPGILVQTDKGQQAVTDNAGTFILSGLAPGNYVVTPVSGDWLFAPTSISITIVASDLSDLQFVGTSKLDVHTISGDIKDAGGVGISGITLRINDLYAQMATTDGDGHYAFVNLGAGSYVVTPSTITGTLDPTSRSVILTDSDVTGVDFVFTPAANFWRVSGTVTYDGNPLAGAWVRTSDTNVAPVQTDSTGAYALLLPDGDYTIYVSKMGYVIAPQDITVAGADLPGVDFVATIGGNTYKISGYVTMNGAPVSGVGVRAGVAYSQTNSVGYFEVGGLGDGAYQVFCGKSGYSFIPSPAWVTINGADVPDVNFEAALSAGLYSLSGTVVDEQGAAVEGVLIICGSQFVATDATGAWMISGLSPGTYQIVPSKEGLLFVPDYLTVTISDADQTGLSFVVYTDVPLSSGALVYHNEGDAVSPSDEKKNLDYLESLSTNIRGWQIDKHAGIPLTALRSGLTPPLSTALADHAFFQAKLKELESKILEQDQVSAWSQLLPQDVDMEITGVGSSGSGGYLNIQPGRGFYLAGNLWTTEAQRVPLAEDSFLTAESAYALRATKKDGVLTWTIVPLYGRAVGPADDRSAEYLVLEVGDVTDAQEWHINAPTSSPQMGARVIALDGDAQGRQADIAYWDPSSNLLRLWAPLAVAPAPGDWMGVRLSHPDYHDPPGELGGRSTPESALVAIVFCGTAGEQPVVIKTANLGGAGKSNVIELPWSDTLSWQKGSDLVQTQTLTFDDPFVPVRPAGGMVALYDAAVGTKPTYIQYGWLPLTALIFDASVAKGINVYQSPSSVTIRVSDGHMGILKDDGSYAQVKAGRVKVFLEVIQ